MSIPSFRIWKSVSYNRSNWKKYFNWFKLGGDIDGDNADDMSGTSVSLNAAGNIVAIGAPRSDSNGNNSGEVKIYEYVEGGGWNQLGSDIAGDAAGDESGTSVSLNAAGNIVAIGSPKSDINGGDSGEVKIYEYVEGGEWIQLGSDIAGDDKGDNSGTSVSLNAAGDVVAIGSPYHSSLDYKGQVRVFDYASGSWTQRGSFIFGEVLSLFGNRVSLNAEGNIFIAGAVSDGVSPLLDSGSASVYYWGGSTWEKRGKKLTGLYYNDYFGTSVSINDAGNIIAIGQQNIDAEGPTPNTKGRVNVYSWSGSSWKRRDGIEGETQDDAASGISVDLNASGNIVAGGAPQNDDNGSNSGHVRVYRWRYSE
mgnify:CR=1 FL=1